MTTILRQLPPRERALYKEILPFLKRIETEPDDIPAYILAVGHLRDHGHTQVALRILEAGLKSNPEAAELFRERAAVRESLSLHEEAFDDYQRALSRRAEDVLSLRGAARTAFRLGDEEAAAEYIKKARALAPDDAGILLDEANFARMYEDYQKALELCRKAQNAAPHRADAFYNAALALLELKRPQDALNEVEKALALEPEAVEAWALRAEAAFALRREDEAAAAARKAIELNPFFEAPHRTLGRLALSAGDEQAALRHFRRAAELNPRDVFSLQSLLGLAEKHNDGELRLFSLRRLSRAVSFDMDLRNRLAEAAFQQKQYSEAAAEYRILIEKNPGRPEYRRGLGRVYEHFEDWEGVIEAYSTLSNLGMATAEERLSLAQALIESGAIDEAETLVADLSGELPAEDPRLLRATGLLLRNQGRAAEALAYLKDAAEGGSADALWDAAYTSLIVSDYETSHDLLERLLPKAAERSDVTRLLAEVKDVLGRREEAAAMYQNLVTHDPDDVQALEFLTRYHYDKGEKRQALEEAEATLRVHPENTEAKRVKGMILAGQGRYSDALRLLSAAAEQAPPSASTSEKMKEMEARADESASAADLWKEYRRTQDKSLLWSLAELEKMSESPLRALRPLNLLADSGLTRRRALREIANLYMLTGNERAALRTASSLAAEFDDASSWTFCAETYWHFVRYDDTLASLKRALEKGPAFAPALRLAARTHLARGNTETALNHYLSLHEMDPFDPDVLLAIARIYAFRLNDRQRTRVYYQKLAQVKEDAPDIERYLRTSSTLTVSPSVVPASTQPGEAPADDEDGFELTPEELGPDLPALREGQSVTSSSLPSRR